MAFPGQNFTTQELQDSRKLRKLLMDKINKISLPTEEVPKQLAQIAQTLGRSVGNEPTAYESGMVRTSASNSASLLERQVERALTQVLGRAPGRGPEGFMSALKGAFPTDPSGQVVFKPARSMISPYSNDNGLTGQISVDQANLYRVGSLIALDALRVLEGLNPFDPRADLDAVEALRSLLKNEITSLVEEFGQLDKPRKERVQTYLTATQQHLNKLGDRSCLSPEFSGEPVTADDEAQIAGYQLLELYLQQLETTWKNFDRCSSRSQISYSRNLSTASVLLPVIAGSNTSFMAAMDSIGFTESERRSESARFSSLNNDKLYLLLEDLHISFFLPEITVNDLNSWIDRFASIESPSILAASGQFGLDSVTDQADTLFWVIGLVLDYILFNEDGKTSCKPLKNILSYERVQQSLRELLSHLNDLAKLAFTQSSSTTSPQYQRPVPTAGEGSFQD
jgi:hypothetical protein